MHQFVPRGARAAFLVALAACTASGGGGGSGGSSTAADTQAVDAAADTGSSGDTAARAETAADNDVAAEVADAAAEVAADTAAAEVATADVVKPKPFTNGTLKEPGDFAPEFSKVVASDGQAVSKADLMGHWTVLWFYPAAQTSG